MQTGQKILVAVSRESRAGRGSTELAEVPCHNKSRRLGVVLLVCLCMVTLAGCLQLDIRITVNEDGSATITERIRFTRQLMDLAGDRKPELMKLLSKEVALERMKRMGDGVVLVSHEVHDTEGASREAVIVYKVPDLNKLVYVSPWF